ncbi:MAG: extracellular solute-binding protein, partial [Lachnospiraceae bacterium]|nr:extracellular solute-binding protein [Lachnospiraceae bacterium]
MKRKALKQALALSLAGAFALGTAACGSSSSTDSGSADSAAASTEAADTTGSTEAAATASTGTGASYDDDPSFYPVKNPQEFTAFTMSMPNVTDLATNDFTKYLENLTGVKIEFETGSRDDWQEKLNLELSSGDYPDIIFGVTPDLAKYGVEEGIIIPLDDYLTEENCPEYLKMFKDQLDLSRESDGKIYSLLATNDCYHCKYADKMWINTKYLDELGVDMPTTTDEFYDVCKKFLEKYPNGIALAGTAPGSGWHSDFQEWLMGSFLLYPGRSYTTSAY